MGEKVCVHCGAPIGENEEFCSFCFKSSNELKVESVNQVVNPINSSWPIRNKTLAGLLAIFFGFVGIHKFYLGKIGQGFLYLIFCWTFVPRIISLIEGIRYLCMDKNKFQMQYHVRIIK